MRVLAAVVVTVGLALSSAGSARADSALVVISSDNGIYETPVRTVAEKIVTESGNQVAPFGEIVVERGVNPAEILRCVDKGPDCMVSATELADVDHVLVFQIRSEQLDQGTRVVLTGYRFDARQGGRELGAQRFCDPCTQIDKLVALAGDLATELIATMGQPGGGYIEVHSTPAGATVAIDGVAVGRAGRQFEVPAGSHRVEVTLPGHASFTRTVEVEAGQTSTLRPSLMPASGADDAADGGFERYYKWGALGGGVALTTLGIAWIAVDGPQTETDAAGNQLRQPEERKTLIPGVISTTLGVGLLGVSGYLFYRELGAERPAPTVAITADGAFAGVAGRF